MQRSTSTVIIITKLNIAEQLNNPLKNNDNSTESKK